MGLTVNQLAIQLLGEQAEKKDDNDYVAQLEIWIKDAITEISSRTKFKFFWKENIITTVIGISSYSLPKEFRDFKYVRHIDNDQIIEYINPRRLADYGLDLELRGKPRYWWISDPTTTSTDFIQKIRLHPIPNAIYSINAPIYYHPVDLISTSVIPVSEEGLLAVKSRVRMWMHKQDKQLELYNIERSQYNQDLASLIDQEKTISGRILINRQTDLPRRSGRPYRLRYPFE